MDFTFKYKSKGIDSMYSLDFYYSTKGYCEGYAMGFSKSYAEFFSKLFVDMLAQIYEDINVEEISKNVYKEYIAVNERVIPPIVDQSYFKVNMAMIINGTFDLYRKINEEVISTLPKEKCTNKEIKGSPKEISETISKNIAGVLFEELSDSYGKRLVKAIAKYAIYDKMPRSYVIEIIEDILGCDKDTAISQCELYHIY